MNEDVVHEDFLKALKREPSEATVNLDSFRPTCILPGAPSRDMSHKES